MNEKTRKILIILLLIGNFIGAISGFIWWYGPQLLKTPWYLWLLTPDCPLYALFFVIAALWIMKKKTAVILTFITSVGLMKYGLWTVFVHIHLVISDSGYIFHNYNLIIIIWLVLSHAIMFAEAFLLLPYINVAKRGFAYAFAALVFFGVNDYFDYYSTTLTTLPPSSSLGLYAMVAGFGTFLFPFLVYIGAMKMKKKFIPEL